MDHFFIFFKQDNVWLIFVIFFNIGGPGSKKGAIVNELICTFGFTLINTERIILHELMKNKSENQVPFDPSAVIRNQLKVTNISFLLLYICEWIQCFSFTLVDSMK